MKVSPTPTPAQALKVLLACIYASSNISYGNEEDKFNHNIEKSQNSINRVSMDTVSRDVFYADFVGMIKEGLTNLDFEGEEELAGVDWEKYFDFENAQQLFECSSSSEGGGDDHTLWVGNIEKKWLVDFSGYVGEYCDEDFDISAKLSVYADLDEKDFEELLSQKVNVWVAHEVSVFCHSLTETQKSLPKKHSSLVYDAMLRQFREHNFTRKYIADREKEVLQENLHLNDAPEASVSSKPRKI